MIGITGTNNASATVAEGETPSTRPLPPVMMARDRRKYTRFLDPLYLGPFLQLFESPEHEALGDGLTFVDAHGNSFTQSPPSTHYFQTDGGQLLSFGQILALAGDFYGVPGQPISDGASPSAQQARFTAAFNTLFQEQPKAGTYQAQKILAVMQQQSNAVSAVAAQILARQPGTEDAWSQAYSSTNNDHQFDIPYNIASGAVSISPWFLSQGSYLQLAAVNWDHFGASAVACYQAGHTVALQTAAAGDYVRAYAMEAFACHFLTDLFSAGHLRTPRKALHTQNQASDLCSQLMHDEDSYNGLVVQNAAGKAWTAYGDKRLNDPLNQTNFGMARAAVVASLNEVVNALKKKNPAASFGALSMIHDLSVVTNRLNTANWSPLYVLINGEPQVRDALTDLRCRVWTDSFLYVSTYWRMPSGGVHSIGGAPPGQGRTAAHAVTWQSHRITGSSENDLAPAAAIVTNLDPVLLNTTPTGQFGSPVLPGQANPTLQNTLCVVFRKTSSDSANHHLHFLAIPMTDAPAFKIYTPTEIAFGSQSSHASDGGDPAVVAQPGTLLMVFPNSVGTLCQTTWSSTTRAWTSPGSSTALLSGDSGMYQLLAPASDETAPRVALCNIASLGLYLAFPTRTARNGGNIVFCAWNNQGAFATPQPVSYSANGATTYPKTSLSVGLVEFDDSLVLAFADVDNSNAIRVLRSTDGKTWTQLTAAVQGANGQSITTHSALSLVPYGGLLMLVVNDASGNITSHAYVPGTGTWRDYLIQGTSNGNTTTSPLQTKYALSAVGWQGDAYVVFTDKANGSPSIMTTAIATAM